MKSPQQFIVDFLTSDADDILSELRILEKEGVTVTDALISILKNTNEITPQRIKAAHSLRFSKDFQSIHTLIGALHELNESINLVASSALAEIGSDAVPHLTSALLSSNDDRFRFWVIQTLAQIRDNHSVEALVSLLRDTNSGGFSASALGEIGDPRAVVPLIEAIQNIDLGSCRPFVVALGKIGDTRALQLLLEHLEDFPEWVRPSAIEAIEKIRLKTGQV